MYGPDARVLILLVACLEGVLKLRACSKNSSFGVLYVAHSKMLARNLACTYYVVLNEISLSVRQPSPLRPGFRGRNLVAMSVATVLPLHRSVIVTNKHSLIMSKSSMWQAITMRRSNSHYYLLLPITTIITHCQLPNLQMIMITSATAGLLLDHCW